MAVELKPDGKKDLWKEVWSVKKNMEKIFLVGGIKTLYLLSHHQTMFCHKRLMEETTVPQYGEMERSLLETFGRNLADLSIMYFVFHFFLQ